MRQAAGQSGLPGVTQVTDMAAQAVQDGWLGVDELGWRLCCHNDETFNTRELHRVQPLCRTLAWQLVHAASPHSPGAGCMLVCP